MWIWALLEGVGALDGYLLLTCNTSRGPVVVDTRVPSTECSRIASASWMQRLRRLGDKSVRPCIKQLTNLCTGDHATSK